MHTTTLREDWVAAWAKLVDLERQYQEIATHLEVNDFFPHYRPQLEQGLATLKEKIVETHREISQLKMEGMTEGGESIASCPFCKTPSLQVHYQIQKAAGPNEPLNSEPLTFLSCENEHNFIMLPTGEAGLHMGFSLVLTPDEIKKMMTMKPPQPPVN